MCSIIGALAMGSIGLGEFDVRGRRRVPSPPAMITAFMRMTVLCAGRTAERCRPSHRAAGRPLPVTRAQPAGSATNRSARPSRSARRARGT